MNADTGTANMHVKSLGNLGCVSTNKMYAFLSEHIPPENGAPSASYGYSGDDRRIYG